MASAFIVATAAISYLDLNGHAHLRVYSSDGNTVTERVNDGSGWQTGSLSQPGNMVSATVWYVGGQSCIRVYCTQEGTTTEWCSDGGGAWYKGAYTTA